jgi:hypothetical protein
MQTAAHAIFEDGEVVVIDCFEHLQLLSYLEVGNMSPLRLRLRLLTPRFVVLSAHDVVVRSFVMCIYTVALIQMFERANMLSTSTQASFTT